MESAAEKMAFEGDDGGIGAVASVETAASSQSDASQTSWTGRHAVNLRISIPYGFGRFYVTVVAGRERRDSARRKDERRKHPLSTFGNLAFLFGLGSVGGIAMLALIQFLGAWALQELGVAVTLE